MNADRVRPALVVVLGVLAVSAAAATLDGRPAESAIGSGDGSGAGAGSGTGPMAGHGNASAAPSIGATPAFSIFAILVRGLFAVTLGLGIPFLVGYAAYLTWRDGLEGLREFLGRGLATAVAAALPLLLFAAAVILVGGSPGGRSGAPPSDAGGSGAGGGPAATETGLVIPPVALALGAVVFVGVGLAVVVAWSSRSDETASRSPDGREPVRRERDESASGEPTTASAVEDVPPANPVYRAWREMAESVDRSGLKTATSAEIARRAVDEGFDRDAVRSLTATFEEVRYGKRPATADRASRARAALDHLKEDGGSDA